MYLQVVGRVVIAFALLYALARLSGKKQISQLTFFDFVTAIAVGDLAAGHLADPGKPLGPFVVGLLTWFGLTLGLDLLVLKSRRIAKVLEGEPTLLIHKGQILEDKLSGTLLRVDHLMEMLRSKGFFDPREVEYAILETDGNLSVLPRSDARPLRTGDFGLAPPGSGVWAEVILEGRIQAENLARFGRDTAWLRDQLAARGISDLREVFYCSMNDRGELYVDRYRDRVEKVVDISDYPGPG
ncbi:MAG: DUF421 domain-containing protein [Firmicutes bacterium]|nr:DUF421 domain-containing protein [Bacillota bacterium]